MKHGEKEMKMPCERLIGKSIGRADEKIGGGIAIFSGKNILFSPIRIIFVPS